MDKSKVPRFMVHVVCTAYKGNSALQGALAKPHVVLSSCVLAQCWKFSLTAQYRNDLSHLVNLAMLCRMSLLLFE